MTREWYSARELAGLPGLPGTERRVRDRATRDGWQARPRVGRGGGAEYHLSSLPAETRRHLGLAEARAAAASPAAEAVARVSPTEERARRERRQRALATLPRLRPAQRARAEARAWVLEAWAQYAARVELSRSQAAEGFAEALRTGAVRLPDELRGHVPTRRGLPHVDRATLYRWQAAFDEEHLAGLAPGYGNRRGSGVLDTHEGLRAVVLGLVAEYPHVSARRVVKYLRAGHPELPRVSARTVTRWLARWKREHAGVWTQHVHPDGWKNAFMPAFGSQSADLTRLNQRWELDSTPGDWLLADGRRYVVLGCIDVWSRRSMLLVSPTSRAESVCALLRRALTAWGVPEQIRTDNGADYTSEQVTSVLRGLGVAQQLCIPFASEQKGTIERHFHTMSHGILDMLPGFVGHNVAEREQIRARQSFAERVAQGQDVEVGLSPEALQELLDQWVEHTYMERPQEALGQRSPRAVVRSWTGEVRRIEDARALDMLLSPVEGTRTVTKKGLRLDHRSYGSAELFLHVGERVQVRRDVADAGRVYVFRLDGSWLCEAVNPELLGLERRELAIAIKSEVGRATREAARELRELKRHIAADPVRVMLEHDRAQASNVVDLPLVSEVRYTTPALEAAGEAARSGEAAPAAPMDERLRAVHEQVRRECLGDGAGAGAGTVVVLEETPRQRFVRWVELRRRESGGEELGEDARRFFRLYALSAEWRAQMREHLEYELKVDGRPVDPAGLDDLLPQVGCTGRA